MTGVVENTKTITPLVSFMQSKIFTIECILGTCTLSLSGIYWPHGEHKAGNICRLTAEFIIRQDSHHSPDYFGHEILSLESRKMEFKIKSICKENLNTQ
jgi:hypothetical protein